MNNILLANCPREVCHNNQSTMKMRTFIVRDIKGAKWNNVRMGDCDLVGDVWLMGLLAHFLVNFEKFYGLSGHCIEFFVFKCPKSVLIGSLEH